MKICNVLCPTDFSPLSDAAIARASAVARRFGAKLHFVYVYEPVYLGSDSLSGPIQPAPPDIDPIRERLESVRPVGDGDVECCHEMLFGFPGSSIVAYAGAKGIDLIVMGTHGRHGCESTLDG